MKPNINKKIKNITPKNPTLKLNISEQKNTFGNTKIATLIKGKSPEEIKNILADDDDDE